jgi:2-oxoglutarate ferredoxin oxidoreductase subunit delta
MGLPGKRRVKKYTVKVNEAYCKGCGYCIEFCPKKVFDKKVELNSKGVNTPIFARPDDCIGCGQCSLLCPDLAIILEDDET